MSLIEKLNGNKFDIVGDIHGEYEALINLLKHLGYDLNGSHPDNRKLIFVGDFCDRGNDSPSVILLIKKLILNKKAQAVLGNHELNLLINSVKSGSGWYFDEMHSKDLVYEPYKKALSSKEEIYNFLSSLPIVLENENLRIVHAMWDNDSVEKLKKINDSDIVSSYKKFEADINDKLIQNNLHQKYKHELSALSESLTNKEIIPKMNYIISEYELFHQSQNPFKVLTSGMEIRSKAPYYTHKKWRFNQRYAWWDHYTDDKPVVIGHYWRKMNNSINNMPDNLFLNIEKTSWHGNKNNVFCIDYSVGLRFEERLNAPLQKNTFLVALRFPENIINLFHNSKKLDNLINFYYFIQI